MHHFDQTCAGGIPFSVAGMVSAYYVGVILIHHLTFPSKQMPQVHGDVGHFSIQSGFNGNGLLGGSQEVNVMHLLWCLWFFVAYYDITIVARHIPGVANSSADHLSRYYMSLFFLFKSTGRASPYTTPSRSPDDHFLSRHGLDITRLQEAVQQYYISGLAPATHKVYQAGQQRYLSFCQQTRLPAVPTTESTLLLFLAFLAKDGLAYTTIKVYIAAIRNLHTFSGLHNTYSQQLTPYLEQVLQGIKRNSYNLDRREYAFQSPQKSCHASTKCCQNHPITITI